MAKKPKVLPPLQWLAPRLRLTRALSLGLFLAALLYVRWKYQLERRLAGEGR